LILTAIVFGQYKVQNNAISNLNNCIVDLPNKRMVKFSLGDNIMAKQKITRDELISRTALVFRKQGYYNTTMNDIGKIIGLLKGSIYHYFQSKE
jgi:hypothetical protein